MDARVGTKRGESWWSATVDSTSDFSSSEYVDAILPDDDDDAEPVCWKKGRKQKGEENI